ncbi:hypothetical protein VIGAN_08046800 [Vigna angularis var. angularis]|uniref:Uncharacterized protein n=1 Tax=Vigna angularis var. angularis TaxID=157739 RepID=A0A0S3SMC3_PHAAN|nr:hypothetical protein VIGAN_08046800 [Vigna angularis var. angularis]
MVVKSCKQDSKVHCYFRTVSPVDPWHLRGCFLVGAFWSWSVHTYAQRKNYTKFHFAHALSLSFSMVLKEATCTWSFPH